MEDNREGERLRGGDSREGARVGVAQVQPAEVDLESLDNASDSVGSDLRCGTKA